MATRAIFAALAMGCAVFGLSACEPKPATPGASLSWAYPVGPAGSTPTVSQGPHQVPGSARTYTDVQINDFQNPVDWFPAEHPPTPAVVAHGQPGGPTPCAECHLINGQGFIGAPNLNGLSAGYIIQQVREFSSGRRQSWQADRFDTLEMVKVARQVSDADLAQAAAYFAALPRRPWVRVVESDQAPVTRPDQFNWLDIVPGGGLEPIKGRVIEVPEDTARTFMADPHSGLVDYVPIGALSRGAALARTGGAAGQPCAACHGADLRGVGDTPPLAGRSAAYLARMLWDIKTGARRGPAVAAMQAPTTGLKEADIADVVAYLASLQP